MEDKTQLNNKLAEVMLDRDVTLSKAVSMINEKM